MDYKIYDKNGICVRCKGTNICHACAGTDKINPEERELARPICYGGGECRLCCKKKKDFFAFQK